jgi:hypothetical protein
VRSADRSSKRYSLVYRSVDHRRLREVCEEVQKSTLSARYAEYAPRTGFGQNLQAFCIAVVDLQKARHAADYDPLARFTVPDTTATLVTARTALKRFRQVSGNRRRIFLSLILFQLRALH